MAPIYLGGTEVSAVYKGSTDVSQAYLGESTMLSSFTAGGLGILEYTGDRPTNAPKTGMGLQPDLIWAKDLDANDHWSILDSSRGANVLSINNTTAQSSFSPFSFDTDGFTVGSSGQMNSSGHDLVAYGWGANGGTLTNGSGTGVTNVQYQANISKGFSIVTYTGSVTGNNKTFTHGLNSAPEYVIIKDYSWSVPSWFTWHTGLSGGDYFLRHESSNAESQNSTVFSSAPSSTHVNIGGDSGVGDRTDNYVAYCWHSVSGYSKFGSYTGNNSGWPANTNTNFISTGFQPDLVMAKSKGSDNWRIYDSQANSILYPNLTNAADGKGSQGHLTFNTTGFTWNTDNNNYTGTSYIYMAWKKD